MSKYTLPQVNLNCTSKAELIAQQDAVAKATEALFRALLHAQPHGRDYALRPHELQAAQDEHADDCQALDAIHARASTILSALREDAR